MSIADGETLLYDCREAFAESLTELARDDPRVVVVCNDSISSSNLVDFAAEFPERLVNVGIAEQDMVGVAAGLAGAGLIPFVCGAAPFMTARALEQIKVDIAYSDVHVVLCGMSPGLAYGALGPTHHSIEDLSWLRAIANLTIIVPSDPAFTSQAVRWASSAARPVFLRVARFGVPLIDRQGRDFVAGRADQLRDGGDVALIAIGIMVPQALEAARLLAEQHIEARVLDMSTLAPLDREAVLSAAVDTGRIVTVEEATVRGGLGAAVAEVVVQHHPVAMRLLGVPGVFAPTGGTAFLLEHFGLTAEGIAAAARELLSSADENETASDGGPNAVRLGVIAATTADDSPIVTPKGRF
jgi:transketolase